MKNVRFFLLLSLSLFVFASCNKSENDEPQVETTQTIEQSNMDGQPFGGISERTTCLVNVSVSSTQGWCLEICGASDPRVDTHDCENQEYCGTGDDAVQTGITAIWMGHCANHTETSFFASTTVPFAITNDYSNTIYVDLWTTGLATTYTFAGNETKVFEVDGSCVISECP